MSEYVSHSLVHSLPEGPLDIVGDVHGEWHALRDLLQHLGYSLQGHHPEGRHLVFVGDLCDRGPDSPSVVDWVADQKAAGRVSVVLGNHELSVLRGLRKDGNDWFYGDVSVAGQGYGPMRMLAPTAQTAVRDFFNALPVVLERDDLRVVHAAWQEEAYQALLARTFTSVLAAFQTFESDLDTAPHYQTLRRQSEAEKSPHSKGLHDPAYPMPVLPGVAAWNTVRQLAHPLRVMTSGVEVAHETPFFVGGSWRFVERAPWWATEPSPIPVVFGHYWRRLFPAHDLPRGPYGRNLFHGTSALEWLGPAGLAYCIDLSVGGRYLERLQGKTSFSGVLGALRLPERELVLDDGRRYLTTRHAPESIKVNHIGCSQQGDRA
jgi:hypothetical protein